MITARNTASKAENELPGTGRDGRHLRVLLANDRLGYETAGLHGAGRLLMDWTRALLERGVEVTPVILRASRQFRELVREEGLPFVFLNRHEFDPRTVGDFVRIIRRDSIQILHLQGYGSSAFGHLAAIRTGVPALVHVHADYRNSVKGYPWYVKAVDRALSGQPARVLAVSEKTRHFAIREQGYDPSRVDLVHNPVDTRRFHVPSAERKAASREALGLTADACVAVTVARLHHWKGVDVLLEAWGDILASSPATDLLVVGDGPHRQTLEASARSSSLAGTVHFAGYRKDVRPFLWAADAAILPSRAEGLPLTLLEAMATGLPVVGTRVGGIPEALSDGENGFLVPSEDPKALASAAARLLSDPARRAEMGAAAVRTAESFGLGPYVERLEELYRTCIRN